MLFVSQAKPSYIHQITASMTATRPSDAMSCPSARTSVSCVRTKTKTRSKKSSSVETRSRSDTTANHARDGAWARDERSTILRMDRFDDVETRIVEEPAAPVRQPPRQRRIGPAALARLAG